MEAPYLMESFIQGQYMLIEDINRTSFKANFS